MFIVRHIFFHGFSIDILAAPSGWKERAFNTFLDLAVELFGIAFHLFDMVECYSHFTYEVIFYILFVTISVFILAIIVLIN
jgi:hypothetical protein